MLDRGDHTSYSACGIPYWMAGEVDSGDELVARTAAQHREAGIDLRLGTEVVAADLAARTVTTAAGDVLEYDELVVATGAPAIVPDWALRPDGTAYDAVGPVKTLDDGSAWLDRFERAGDGAHVVVVGAGYIGVEVAEAALRRGLGVTVVTRGRGLALLEDEMSERVAVALCDAGAEVVLGVEVTGLDTVQDERGDRVTGVRWDGGGREADLVVLAIGVRPGTGFLDGAGWRWPTTAPCAPTRTAGSPTHVWAAGDCCEVRRRIDDRWVFRPLGTHATKHGRALGRQPGRVARWPSPAWWTPRSPASPRASSTSRSPAPAWARAEAEGAGLDPVALVTEGTHRQRLHARGRADRDLGDGRPDHPPAARRAGRRRARRRQAHRHRGRRCCGRAGTVDDLAWMDLAYAPPFATTWDVLQIAARRVAERL